MKGNKAPPIYQFEEGTEKALVLALCTQPRFYSAIGAAIEADRLKDPSAKLLAQAAHAVAKKVGGGPTRPMYVIQHLVNLMGSGKLTHDQVNACKDYILDAELEGVGDVDHLIAAVVPVVQRVKHKEVIESALEDYKNNADPEKTTGDFEKLSKLGKTSNAWGASLQQLVSRPNFFKSIKDGRLGTGIPDIDAALGGGLERSAIGLLVGGSGAGKSMTLGHIAAHGILQGIDTVLVSLELSEETVGRRLLRNLVDMTQREIETDQTTAMKRLGMLQMGRLMIGYAEPIVTSPRDIRARIAEYKRDVPDFDPKLFVIDMADKLRVNLKDSVYNDMGLVIEGLRSMAVEVDGWAWTASQSDRKSTGKPWLDLSAVADSMNKIRTADLVITAGRTEEDEVNNTIRFLIPKRREGEGAHAKIGPLPCDQERGRICMVDREFPW